MLNEGMGNDGVASFGLLVVGMDMSFVQAFENKDNA